MHPCYLVALKQVVIAQDIAQTILDHDPEAEVILGGGFSAMPEDRLPHMAFLDLSPAEARSLAAARDLLAHGTRLVLIGDAAEAAGESHPFWVLHRPFTSDAVLSLLARAAAERRDRIAG